MGGKTKLFHCPFMPTVTPENNMNLRANKNDPAKKSAYAKAKAECFNTLDQDRYISEVLEKVILPYIKEHNKKCPRGKQIVFVHDNASCHGTKKKDSKVHKWLKAKGIKVCPLAPCSPDTNPIELVFGCVKQACKGKMMRTKEDIVKAYEKAWKDFPMSSWDKMIKRLPAVLKQIKKDKGGNFNTR